MPPIKGTVKAILRYDTFFKEPLLFFPDAKCRPPFILAYARNGGHVETAINYYHKRTKPLATDPLVAHYETHYNCKLILIKRRPRQWK